MGIIDQWRIEFLVILPIYLCVFHHPSHLRNIILIIISKSIEREGENEFFDRNSCRFQGDDTLDPDLPTYFEAWLFQSHIGKIFYIIAQPLLYGVRPLLRVPKPVTLLEVVNLVIELAFVGLMIYFFGLKSFVYLLFGTLLGLGLHPISGHFISGK